MVVAHRKWVFENYQILCFLTHVRDLAALLPGNCSQFRCGSFSFSKNRDFSKTCLNTLQKISAISENSFFLIAKYFDGSLGPWALGPMGPWAWALGPWALRPSARRGPGPGPWVLGPGAQVSRQRGFEQRHIFSEYRHNFFKHRNIYLKIA